MSGQSCDKNSDLRLCDSAGIKIKNQKLFMTKCRDCFNFQQKNAQRQRRANNKAPGVPVSNKSSIFTNGEYVYFIRPNVSKHRELYNHTKVG